MSRSWDVVEKAQPTVGDRLGKTNGWLLGVWAVVLVLVGAVVSMIFSQAADDQRVKRLEDELNSAKRVAALAQQANSRAEQAAARADSAKQLAGVTQQRLAAINTKMMELASRQYAIEVRADRLDSAITQVAADLNELGEAVDNDFNAVSDRIDSAFVVANAAVAKADEAQRSATQLRGGFDALRSDLDRRNESAKWQNRLAVGLGVVNTVVWGIHIVPDSHHK
ncbi:MAG: hypothetical protein HY420_03580 [Candidatus Kerfeldbacteria bacterium]|nr:hypothetical protein [Candidatus Kerfeldbacteria bacterium]